MRWFVPFVAFVVAVPGVAHASDRPAPHAVGESLANGVVALALGLPAVLLLLGLYALKARRRSDRRPAPARPSRRWLRERATKELAELTAMLPPDPDAPGGDYATRAHEAATRLSDVVGPDPDGEADPMLDLVGVILLARQGMTVLAEGTERPRPPCYVNPLHPPATREREIGGRGPRPVCTECAEAPPAAFITLFLRTPDHRHHFAIPGRWQSTGFGTEGRDLPIEVLESLDSGGGPVPEEGVEGVEGSGP
ncbi:hypothetical protein [Thermomonospora umbrina]|nr:hypothetical protein [Thermomonospora umbrina]